MGSTELKNKAGSISLVVFLALVFSSVTYAQRADFLLSTVVPLATGYVDIKPDHNKNYIIAVKVADLAEAKKLIPAKQVYVVWIITEQTIIKNIGEINGSTGFFSKKVKPSLETVSPFKPIKVFITTEYNASVQYPSSQIVLTTQRI
ncbi:hypothetical protein [Emticicia sp. C21]|uniref:hypothetical protein n=1 Tax=Emticicia sp. C21 TaxID=2302915 RepID=UPI000E3575E0|nr:hypothetical protein [Emticicia sp. C21]RFS17045.1 hypothetical protein D0T08_10240 [Emticicia sp. C21]